MSELYYPEQTSTGRFMTGIAEGLASEFAVRVLCAQPTYSARGTVAPREEVRNDVRIYRCPSTLLDKNNLLFRAVNILTISASMFLSALRRIRRGDLVLVVTNPPLVPYLLLAVCAIRRARLVLLVHDVYPEVFVATGLLASDSGITSVIRAASRMLYRRVDRIVVLGRDMRDLLVRRDASLAGVIEIIPNWGDTDEIKPIDRHAARLLRARGLSDKFVVQYLGNMGRTHAIDLLLDTAVLLKDMSPDIHFVFAGSGARRGTVEQRIVSDALDNVTLLPGCSEAELPDYLASCDASIISFVPGMSGVSVPSRMYNVLASGRPILAVSDAGSELSQVVTEEHVGWSLPATSTPEDLAKAIVAVAHSRAHLETMRARARTVVETKYSREAVVSAFRTLFRTFAAEDGAA